MAATPLPVVGSSIGTWGEQLNAYLRSIVVHVGDKGAVGDGVTDDSAAIQAAIDAVLAAGGGTVYLPAGIYRCNTGLHAVNAAARTVRLQGAGMYATTIRSGTEFGFNGLLGYYTGSLQAQMIVNDMTLDGNYAGLGGTLAVSVNGAAIVAAIFPFTDAASGPTSWTGGRHSFNRVRLYRPTAYAFQGVQGVLIDDCLFEGCGQPNLSAGSTHFDILGSGAADAIVTNSRYLNCSGNFVDFVEATDANRIKLVFIGNRSYGHTLGGIYGLGNGCIIEGNDLSCTAPGGGVAYDAATSATNAGRNVVANNTGNGTFRWMGQSAAKPGDQYIGNVDQLFTATWDPASLAAGAQTTTTVAAANAQLGDRVSASFSLSLQALQLTGYVSAADTVTVVLRNGTAGTVDLASGTLTVKVERG